MHKEASTMELFYDARANKNVRIKLLLKGNVY